MQAQQNWKKELRAIVYEQKKSLKKKEIEDKKNVGIIDGEIGKNAIKAS